ncbi:hypothetical protein T484DRAFT_1799784, partial [Baffinella frigidus]
NTAGKGTHENTAGKGTHENTAGKGGADLGGEAPLEDTANPSGPVRLGSTLAEAPTAGVLDAVGNVGKGAPLAWSRVEPSLFENCSG